MCTEMVRRLEREHEIEALVLDGYREARAHDDVVELHLEHVLPASGGGDGVFADVGRGDHLLATEHALHDARGPALAAAELEDRLRILEQSTVALEAFEEHARLSELLREVSDREDPRSLRRRRPPVIDLSRNAFVDARVPDAVHAAMIGVERGLPDAIGAARILAAPVRWSLEAAHAGCVCRRVRIV